MSKSRIELSEAICQYMYRNYGVRGRVHFTVGGAQAVDDAMKITINHNHKRGFLAFEGAYHGRTMAASSVSSSYRYTRQFGSVMNVQRIPFSNCFTCAYDKNPTDCDLYCLKNSNKNSKANSADFMIKITLMLHILHSYLNQYWGEGDMFFHTKSIIVNYVHSFVNIIFWWFLMKFKWGFIELGSCGVLSITTYPRYYYLWESHYKRTMAAFWNMGKRGTDFRQGLACWVDALYIRRTSDGNSIGIVYI